MKELVRNKLCDISSSVVLAPPVIENVHVRYLDDMLYSDY